MTVQQIADRIRKLPDGSRILVLGPLIKDRKTEGERVFAAARRQGFVRVRVDGELMDLDEAPALDKYKRHSIEVVVDRLIVRHQDADGNAFGPDNPDPDAARLADSVETALRLGEGVMLVAPADEGAFDEQRYSEKLQLRLRRHHHRRAGAALVLLQLAARRLPRLHRPGHPPRVRGRPHHPRPLQVHPRRRHGAVAHGAHGALLAAQDDQGHHGRPRLGLPRRRRGPARRRRCEYLLFAKKSEKVEVRYKHERGENSYVATFEGVVTNLERRYRETESDYIRTELEKYMVERHCPTCDGKRLKPDALGVTIEERNISDVAAMSVSDALAWVAALPQRAQRARDGHRPHGQQGDRRPPRLPRRRGPRLPHRRPHQLDALRAARRSASAWPRRSAPASWACSTSSTSPPSACIRRTTPSSSRRSIRLRDIGNTLIVVEHDEETIRVADWVVDIGPAAGEHGGEVIASGPLAGRAQGEALADRRLPAGRADGGRAGRAS